MKHIKLLELVCNVPLLLTESAFWSIQRLIENHLLSVDQRDRSAEYCGEKVMLDSMTVENGVATIPVGGAIGPNLGNFEKLSGAVDTNDIRADIQEAESNPEVTCVLFDIDSPGGMHRGTPELAACVAEMAKPNFAFSSGGICSAAYYFASSTDGIFVTQSAEVGSIGTLLGYIDRSKQFADAGLKVELIKAGKYKGMGMPGTSLNSDHRAYLQAQVNEINDAFKSHVAGHRPDIEDETMQGQTFIGSKSVEVGLCDGIVKDKAELLAMLPRLAR